MPANQQTTVLIVEDDPGVALLQRKALERRGFAVLAAATAADAIRVVEEQTVDLVVLDYQLPGGATGIELYAQLKANGHDLPVIIVTGYSNESTAITALREGVRDYIPKSAEYLDYLPRAVEKVLEQVRTEEALRDKEEQLRHSQKMEALGALAGGVAHEFNNLLQAVQSFSRFAQEGLDRDDTRYADLEQVLAAADRAARLTRQLLGFSRRQEPEFVQADANRLVEDVAKMLRPLLGADISTALELGHGAGEIYADASQLQQVVMNLCINARDAMPGGGRIVLKTERVALREPQAAVAGEIPPGPYFQLTVSDDGCGMPPDIVERIFEPFFTTKATGKGTGLGLAMAFSIVRQHQGHIRVSSVPKAGTAFQIYLPLVERPTAAEAHLRPVDTAGGGELVLLAEDEALVRGATVRILERAGYRTLAAADGHEALALLRSYADEVAILLLDLVMPGPSGREVYDQSRTTRPDLPVVFCTSSDRNAPGLSHLPVGHVRTLQKPFTPAELLMAVRAAVEGKTTCQPDTDIQPDADVRIQHPEAAQATHRSTSASAVPCYSERG